MSTHSDLVRSVMRWALMVVAKEEADRSAPAGPRLSQLSLGSYLVRSDPETLVAIAKDIALCERAEITDIYMAGLISSIRAHWGAPPPTKVRRTGAEDTVLVASRAVSSLKKFGDETKQRVIRTCCTLKTWTSAAEALPGRDPRSLRDDFERYANEFYRKETKTICDTAEYITHLARLGNAGGLKKFRSTKNNASLLA